MNKIFIVLFFISVCAFSGYTPIGGGGGGGSPGGSNEAVQYNNSGAFGGFGTWNGTTLTVPNISTGNIIFNNSTAGANVTTASGTTNTLTVSSARIQILIGSTLQAYRLPNATTLSTGFSLNFNNDSTGQLFIVYNDGSAFYTVPPGAAISTICDDISTTNGMWDVRGTIPSNSTFGTTGLTFLTGTASLNGGPGNTVGVGSAGIPLNLFGGTAGGTGNNSGGIVSISSGNSTGDTNGADVFVAGGAGGTGSGTAGANGGSIVWSGGIGGVGSSTSGTGGAIQLVGGHGGAGVAGGTGGATSIVGGPGGVGSASGGSGGSAVLQGGAAAAFAGTNGGSASLVGAVGSVTGTGGAGGAVAITGGNAGGSGNNNGGNVTLTAGTATGSGSSGVFNFKSGSTSLFGMLPTGDFQIAGSSGSSGRVFTTAGAGAPPTYSLVSLSSSVTGTLPKTNGGTGATSFFDEFTGHIQTPGNATYWIDPYPYYGYTIQSIAIYTSAGTITCAVQINGTNVTSLSAISVSATPQIVSATGANTVTAGANNAVTLVCSSNSSGADLVYTLGVTR